VSDRSTGSRLRWRVVVVGVVLACLVALVAGFGSATAGVVAPGSGSDEVVRSASADAGADFEVSNLDVPESASADESVRVFVDVTNNGTDNDTQRIELRVDGLAVESTDVTLDPGASGALVFTFGTRGLSPGDHTVGVYSDDDSETATMTVGEGSTNVTVEDVTAPASATVGETITVSAVLNNTGTVAASPTLEVRANGSAFVSRTVTLNATASATVSLSVSTVGLAPGAYTVTAVAAGDSATTTVRVEDGCDLSAFVRSYDADDDCAISLTELGQASADFANTDISLTQLGAVSTAFANT